MATIKNIPALPDQSAVPLSCNPRYLVTRSGFVYDTAPRRGLLKIRPLCHVINNIGYVKVMLYMPDGSRKLTSVHRIIASTFLPPEEGKPDINHKDLNKQNNTPENLEWIAHGKNLEHARYKLGNWSMKRNPASIQPYLSYQFIDNQKTKGNITKYPSLIDAALSLKKPYHTFAAVIAKAIKRQGYAYGYLWEKIPK